tara:strand:- start:629 stop:901 length:273 start_codon:yes stop_codon:yes gene_type:complete
MKNPEEMLEILGAIEFVMPDDIHPEEMCCIISWLIGVYGLHSNWPEMKKRISNNVSGNMSADIFFIAKEDDILSAQKDANDFLGRIVNAK